MANTLMILHIASAGAGYLILVTLQQLWIAQIERTLARRVEHSYRELKSLARAFPNIRRPARWVLVSYWCILAVALWWVAGAYMIHRFLGPTSWEGHRSHTVSDRGRGVQDRVLRQGRPDWREYGPESPDVHPAPDLLSSDPLDVELSANNEHP